MSHGSSKLCIGAVLDLVGEIFRSQEWLQRAVSLGANPVWLSKDLILYMDCKQSPIYLALMFMEFSSDLEWELFKKYLKQLNNNFDKSFNEGLAEYSPLRSRIILNLWESFKRDDYIEVSDFGKLFK